MSSSWGSWLLAVTSNPEGAGTFLSALYPSCGGAGNFYNGAKLRQIGSAETTPTRWCTGFAIKNDVVPILAEFESGVYPQSLIDAGLTVAGLDDVSTYLILRYGSRAELENGFDAFIASLGYEIIP